MQRLIYVPPDGDFTIAQKRIVIADEAPFVLSELSGTGGVEADILSSQVVGMDGEDYEDCRKEPRVVKCTFYVQGQSRGDMYSQRMNAIGMLRKTGKQKGMLYYENDIISVRLEAVPKVPPDFEVRLRNYNRGTVEFYCPDPDWQSLSELQENIGYVEGVGFSMPAAFNPYVSFARRDNDTDISYNGTANAPVRITVVGPSDTPCITNETTGKSIRLTRSISTGEILTINTQRGRKSVILTDTTSETETDAFGYLDPTSEFWELVPGVNHIVYEGGQAQTAVHITYTTRYSGV